jgi:hypothetical protein
MNSRARTFLVLGLLLILGGAWKIALVNNPQLQRWWESLVSWPLIVVAVGLGLLLLGLLLNVPDMAIPACIVAGIGLILYYQNESGNWASWAYMWALIPGFAGLGTVLAGILGGGGWRRVREGLDTMLISLIMYAVFAALFVPMFGGPSVLGPYGPAVLFVAAGLYVIIRGVLAARKKKEITHAES